MPVASGPLGGDLRPQAVQSTDHTLPILLVFLCFCGMLGFPSVLKARHQRHLIKCKTNLKNIATALEFYSSDNQGSYPLKLSKLLRPGPNGRPYLTEIPTCPAAGCVTYENYRVCATPDTFSFCCEGMNHFGVQPLNPVNFPRYDAEVSCAEDHP